LLRESRVFKGEGEFNAQVAGAFYKEGLGDIDLVWGKAEKDSKGQIKGYGLSKIIEKHYNNGEFLAFGEGEKGLMNGLSEIIEKGKVISENGVNTIWYKKGNEYYKVGLSQGFEKQGNNNWIVTAYEAEREKDKTFGDVLFTDKRPLPNSSKKLDIGSPRYEANFTNKSVSEQSKTDDVLLNNQQSNSTTNAQIKQGKTQQNKDLFYAAYTITDMFDDFAESMKYHTKEKLTSFYKFTQMANYPQPRDRSFNEIAKLTYTKEPLSEQDISDMANYLYKNVDTLKDNKKIQNTQINAGKIAYKLALEIEPAVLKSSYDAFNALLKEHHIHYEFIMPKKIKTKNNPLDFSQFGYMLKDLLSKESLNAVDKEYLQILSQLKKTEIDLLERTNGTFFRELKNEIARNIYSNTKDIEKFAKKYLPNFKMSDTPK
ncbi:hypothetical protein CCZ01_09620, partial [Helicobacter monodelphidis]